MLLVRITLVVLACTAGLTAAVSAQDQGRGILEFTATADEDGDGEYTPALCSVIVYERFDGKLPRDSNSASDMPPPVTSESTGRTGIARIELPAGEYTVRRTCSYDLTSLRLNYPVEGQPQNAAIFCCPVVRSSPRQRVIYNEEDEAVLVAQDIEIRAGAVTRASVAESPNLPATKKDILLTLAIVGGGVAAGIGLVAAWKFRPRYDPKSDPKNPKRLKPRGPEPDPAGFDKVFGDFLKKR